MAPASCAAPGTSSVASTAQASIGTAGVSMPCCASVQHMLRALLELPPLSASCIALGSLQALVWVRHCSQEPDLLTAADGVQTWTTWWTSQPVWGRQAWLLCASCWLRTTKAGRVSQWPLMDKLAAPSVACDVAAHSLVEANMQASDADAAEH